MRAAERLPVAVIGAGIAGRLTAPARSTHTLAELEEMVGAHSERTSRPCGRSP